MLFELFKKSLDCENIECLFNFVLSSRYLNEQLCKFPDKVLYDLKTLTSDSNIYYLPVDLIDLRYILKYEESANKNLVLVSLDLTKKYYLDTMVFMGVEIVENYSICGGFAVPLNCNLSIKKDLIKKVLIRSSSNLEEKLNSILKDFELNVEIFPIVEVQGLMTPKLASLDVKKFVVNMPSLGIENEYIVSETGPEALDEALSRKWRSIGEGKPRPINYLAKFWIDNPLWNQMVKLANKGGKLNIFRLKEAQQTMGNRDEASINESSTNINTPAWEKEQGLAHSTAAPIPFQVGDKVRLRYKGLTQDQSYGEVSHIKDGEIYINWSTGKYKGKATKHDVNNPMSLALLFEKV